MNMKSNIVTSNKSIVNPIIVNGEIVGYLPREIPDTLTPEIERISREAWVRDRHETQEEERRREDVKNARMLATKEDKYLHVINLITEYAEAAKSPQNLKNGNDPNRFSIPYFFFNFENHIKSRGLLEAFLSKLQEYECFSEFSWFSSGRDINFHFKDINLNKLKRYGSRLLTQEHSFKQRDVTGLIKLCGLIGEEKKLVETLSDGELHPIPSLSSISPAIYQLKLSVDKKIKKRKWSIVLIRSASIGTDSFYRLIQLNS